MPYKIWGRLGGLRGRVEPALVELCVAPQAPAVPQKKAPALPKLSVGAADGTIRLVQLSCQWSWSHTKRVLNT